MRVAGGVGLSGVTWLTLGDDGDDEEQYQTFLVNSEGQWAVPQGA